MNKEDIFKDLVSKYKLDSLTESELEVLKEMNLGTNGISNIVSQNYMIIAQLSKLNQNIEKLLDKLDD